MMNARPDLESAREALRHFAAAFCFLLLGLIALVWNSGRLADGDFMDHRVLGGLHLLTLGWLSLSVFGALKVFSGVFLGTKGFIWQLAPLVRYLWTAGTAAFASGIMFEVSALIIAGVFLLGLALLFFSVHFVPAICGAGPSLTKWFISIALFSLWGAFILGLTAALARAEVAWAQLPPGYFSAHILLAVFGWIGANTVGVGSVLIPMFTYSKGHKEWPVKASLPLWVLIPILACLGSFLESPYLELGWIAAGIGSALWIFQVLLYLRARLAPKLDPGMLMAGGSTLLLAVGWLFNFAHEGSLSFIGLVLVGWLALFTLGIYHRVIPFLTWFLLISRERKGITPKLEQLLQPRTAMMTELMALTGAFAWGLSLLLQIKSLTCLGSGLILMAALIALLQLKTLLVKS